MAIGDRVLFYHSNADPPAAVGLAEVIKTAYADPTQFDQKDEHYDPDSDPSRPRWDAVDIKYIRKFSQPVSLDQLRKDPKLKGMVLLQEGSRLSVQPVTPAEWKHILTLG
jgi:predicted RNA-binding protein with PUA-like domain